MKIHIQLTGLMAAAAAMIALQANAAPILLNGPDDGFPASSGDGQIQTWLTSVVNDYNADNTPNPPTPLPTDGIGPQPDIKVNTGETPPAGFPQFGDDTVSITMPTGNCNYLVFHWGGPKVDENPEFSYQAWYIGGELPGSTSEFTAPRKNGLSFYSYYDCEKSVPDGGATLALLGLACLGLAGATRASRK